MNKKTLLGVFPCAQIFKGPTATLLLVIATLCSAFWKAASPEKPPGDKK